MIFGITHTRGKFNNGDYPLQIWTLKNSGFLRSKTTLWRYVAPSSGIVTSVIRKLLVRKVRFCVLYHWGFQTLFKECDSDVSTSACFPTSAVLSSSVYQFGDLKALLPILTIHCFLGSIFARGNRHYWNFSLYGWCQKWVFLVKYDYATVTSRKTIISSIPVRSLGVVVLPKKEHCKLGTTPGLSMNIFHCVLNLHRMIDSNQTL